jgi:metal-sulfur cluster biosynthetic enzyme
MSDIAKELLPPPDGGILLEWLRPVQDPELFLGLVDLGLIYSVNLEGDIAQVKMTLTSPGCPSADYLISQVKSRLEEYPGVAKADVQVVFDPKWDPRVMASDEVKDKLGIW